VTPRTPPGDLERIMERLERDLAALYGPGQCHRWSDGALVRLEGETVVFVVASPLDDDLVVNVRTYLARGPERIDGALGLHLARLNAETLFGAFSIDEDGDVCFDYSLLASSLTRDALRVAMRSVIHAAERHAGEILVRWGGVSSLEALRRQMEAAPEPEDEDEDDDGSVGPN